MRCPHCGTGIHFEGACHVYRSPESNETPQGYEVSEGFCPLCGKLIVLLRCGDYRYIDEQGEIANVRDELLLFPKYSARLLDDAVPEKYRKIFAEATAVLDASPRASAALSRRLLQQLLRDEYKIQLGPGATLQDEIQKFCALPNVPDDIKGVVDELRVIGNWAAHPVKYKNTGEIVPVEPHEAEWMLDILEGVFDILFVQPKVQRARRERFEQKRRGVGR